MKNLSMCPNCHRPVHNEDVYCTNCGVLIVTNEKNVRCELQNHDYSDSHYPNGRVDSTDYEAVRMYRSPKTNMLKDLGAHVLWSLLTVVASALPAFIVSSYILMLSPYQSIGSSSLRPVTIISEVPLDAWQGLMFLPFGSLFGFICLRITKQDVHKRRLFGFVAGIILDCIAAFFCIVFPDMLNAAVFDRVVLPLSLFALCVILIVYIVGPYSIALSERNKNSIM